MNNEEDRTINANNADTGEQEFELEGVGKGRELLKTGLLMLSSALLGGVAFAIWNRRQISNMQQQRPAQSGPSPADDDAIY